MIDHKNIHEAILGIMAEVGYVQKQKSAGLNYTYAGEASLIAALRPAMIEHGVYCCVLSAVPQRDQFITTKGAAMNISCVTGSVRFTHAPSGTFVDVMAIGEGMDSGDKSSSKAATGLMKYALRQTFLIETGDDPDKHSSEEMTARAMTLDDALSVTNSEGVKYGDIPTEKLAYIANNPKTPAIKKQAAQMILKSRMAKE